VNAGAKWIQVDEPIFGLTFKQDAQLKYYAAFKKAATALEKATQGKAHLIFTTYFNGIGNNLQIVKDLPDGMSKLNYCNI
jgi:methionine synthase II (cobalamin-independent)